MRILKDGGSFFIYNMPKWAFHLAHHLDSNGLEFRHWIALSMKGTFPRGKKLYPAHYALLYFTKGDPKVFNRVRLPIPACRHCGKDLKDYGGHRKYLNPEGLNLTDFWEDTSPARHGKHKVRWHINELKPLIPSRCIEISTCAGDLVVDPFGGGGSTFEAAQRLGRRWLGTEVVDCSLVRTRLEREFPAIDRSFPSHLREAFVERSLDIPITKQICPESSKKKPTTAPKNGLNGWDSAPLFKSSEPLSLASSS